MAKLKIVWYNVLRGFHRKEKNGSYTFEQNRLTAAKKIISSLNPDIIFFGEGDFNPLCKITGPRINIIDYQKEFNYPYVYYAKPDTETSRKSEVILSKFGFKCKNYSTPNNNLFTQLNINLNYSNKNITIDMIHPYPTIPEKEKASWVEQILSKKTNPYILLGDFNALSPKDKYVKQELVNQFNEFIHDIKKASINAEQSLKCFMVKEVTSAGLTDTYLAKNNKQSDTIPTKNYLSKGQKSGIRIDYIFCSSDFKILESGIFKNKLTEKASDHYPIYATLEI
jgi:endonuclease/exonuclease/phosphatase family metal-dependent hydrolase